MSQRFNVLTVPTPAPSLIMAWPDGTPTPAADPAVLATLRAKGYTLEQRDGFTCLIVRLASIVDVMEVRNG